MNNAFKAKQYIGKKATAKPALWTPHNIKTMSWHDASQPSKGTMILRVK